MRPKTWSWSERMLPPGGKAEFALGGRGSGIEVVRYFSFHLQGRHPRIEASIDGVALRTPSKVVTRKSPRLWMSEPAWVATTWEGLTGSVLHVVNTGRHRVRVQVMCMGVGQ